MTESPPETQKPKSPLWMRLLLIGSLGLNLLVLGVVGGVAYNNLRDGDGDKTRISVDGPNPFLRAMTREDAQRMRRLLRPDESTLGASRETGRQALFTILNELRSETVTEDTLRGAFDQMSAANNARLQLGQDAIVTHLLTLDGDERSAFADRLEDSLQRRGPPRNGDRPPRQP